MRRKIKLTREELEMVVEVADRIARRTGEVLVINFERVKVVEPKPRKPRDPVDAEPSRRLIKPKQRKRDLQSDQAGKTLPYDIVL